MEYAKTSFYILLFIWCVGSFIFGLNGMLFMMNQLYKTKRFDKEIINCIIYFLAVSSVSFGAAIVILRFCLMK